MMNLTNLLIGLALSLAVPGCKVSNAAPEPGGDKVNQSQPPSESPAATKVVRIVFVGKEHACDCTRKTVDTGWAALQQVLGTPAKLPVERLQIDTQAEKVAPYRQQKPIMALPAIYFLDGSSVVLEMLQGEVTADAITAVLKKRTP